MSSVSEYCFPHAKLVVSGRQSYRASVSATPNMATAAQNPTIATVGKAPAGKADVMAGSCDPDDPTLTPSQRRKRPLSIIKESDTDSDASNEALVGKGNNSNSSQDSTISHRKSMPSLGQSGTAAAAGKVSSPRRTASIPARCSPVIRKLTENFERSGGSSPSRITARLAPKSSTTAAATVRNGKTSSGGAHNNNSMNNSAGSGSSPRTNSPRTVANKPAPTSVTKINKTSPSSSPAIRAVPPSSPTTRTSSPSQGMKPGVRPVKRVPQQAADPGSKQPAVRGVAAANVDKKRPVVKQPFKTSNSVVKNVKTSPRSEQSLKVSDTKKGSGGEAHHMVHSQNGEKEFGEGEGVSSETPFSPVEIVIDLGDTPASPTPLRLVSLSSSGDVNPIPRDGGGLARIRETAERLKLTSPSSPLSPSPSNSPKFNHRVRFATHRASPPLVLMASGSQSPPISRGGAVQAPSSSSAIPHITITHSDGKVRGPPPQLGPSVSPKISPSSPSSPSSTPLSAIAEAVDPNSTHLDEHDDRVNNNTNSNRTEALSTENVDSGHFVSSVNSDVSNYKDKSVVPYNPLIINFNYHNSLNSSDHSNRAIYPRPTFLHGTRSPTSTHPQSATSAQPHYKLSSSAFFTRRLSSGGSSICEEEEEEGGQGEGWDSQGKAKEKESERGGGEGGTTSSSSTLLSERGSSVSSLGSTTSINSNSTEPTSPPLPQPPSVQHLSASHLCQLKETADKLRLSTRRDSTMAWRQKYLDSPGHMRSVSVANGGLAALGDGRLTQDRKQRIDAALDWLREELVRWIDHISITRK